MNKNELKDRILEIALCIKAFFILVLIAVVVYFISGEAKPDYDVNKDGKVDLGDVSMVYNYYKNNGVEYNVYDLNEDGEVDITDLLISVDKTNEIRDYILNDIKE